MKNNFRGKIFIFQSNLYRSGCSFVQELTILLSQSTKLSLCVLFELWFKLDQTKHFKVRGRRGRTQNTNTTVYELGGLQLEGFFLT